MGKGSSGGTRVPLSLVQEHMWDLRRWAPSPGFYNEAVRHRLPAAVGPGLVSDALAFLTQRHESLRTTFPSASGRPYQSIAPSVVVDLAVTDLRRLGPEERAGDLRRIEAADAEAPFDVARGPVFRARLFLLADDARELCLVFDHLVVDATSRAVVTSELDDVLAALAAGEEPALPRQEIDYADFAVWQRQWMSEERLREHQDFWVDHLRGMAPARPLPYRSDLRDPSRLGSSDLTPAPAVHVFAIDAGVIDLLRRATRSSSFVLAAAAVAAVVARSTGDPDTVALTSVGGRDRAEIDGVVGLFGGNSVLRIDLSGDPAFELIVRRARASLLGVLEHQHVPLSRIVGPLRENGIVLSPLAIPVAIHFFHAAHHRWVPGTSVVAHPPCREGRTEPDLPEASKPLEFRFFDDGAQLWCELLYHPGEYDDATAARVVSDVKGVLRAAAADPLLRLSRLPVSGAAEVG